MLKPVQKLKAKMQERKEKKQKTKKGEPGFMPLPSTEEQVKAGYYGKKGGTIKTVAKKPAMKKGGVLKSKKK